MKPLFCSHYVSHAWIVLNITMKILSKSNFVHRYGWPRWYRLWQLIRDFEVPTTRKEVCAIWIYTDLEQKLVQTLYINKVIDFALNVYLRY